MDVAGTRQRFVQGNVDGTVSLDNKLHSLEVNTTITASAAVCFYNWPIF